MYVRKIIQIKRYDGYFLPFGDDFNHNIRWVKQGGLFLVLILRMNEQNFSPEAVVKMHSKFRLPLVH